MTTTAPSPCPPVNRRQLLRARFTWPNVVALALCLTFVGFVLWLTATTFDVSELKSWVGIAAVFLANHIWPAFKRAILDPQTDLYSGGGQAE